MSDLDMMLTSSEPLDDFDRSRLADWLRVLKEDCEMFGPTGEDIARMNAIRRRIADTETAKASQQ
jgi:hypothetical protein